MFDDLGVDVLPMSEVPGFLDELKHYLSMGTEIPTDGPLIDSDMHQPTNQHFSATSIGGGLFFHMSATAYQLNQPAQSYWQNAHCPSSILVPVCSMLNF